VNGAARWALLVVGLVAPVTLAADSPAPDLAAEIAWARAQWPDELRGVRFQIPLARLLDWVPPGRIITAFVHSPSHACLPVELSRARDALLEARIVTRRWVEGGRQRRQLTVAWVGAEFNWEDSDDEIEVRAPDGTWRMESSSGYGTMTDLGALSSVEGGVARFDGYALRLSPYCDGPVEWLPCTAGGEHPCERCDAVGLMVTAPVSLGGRSRHHDRPVACHEACPRYPESPDLSRLNRLARRVSVWRPDSDARSQNAALYRSRDACLRDHPPASARAKG
jgi:hypothetical protein